MESAALHRVPSHSCGTAFIKRNLKVSKADTPFQYPVNYCIMCRVYSFDTLDELSRGFRPFETTNSQEMKRYISDYLNKDKFLPLE